MRRRYVIAMAWTALAAGLVAGAPAGAQDGAAEYRAARAQMNAALDDYRESVVYRVFDLRPATYTRLRADVARFDRAVTRLEALEERGDAPVRDPLELHDLREAQEHMEDYMDASLGGDRVRMQITTWRFLWVLNRLPLDR